MADLPLYAPQVSPGASAGAMAQPPGVPQLADGGAVVAGVGAFAQAMGAWSERLQHARTETLISDATTAYLKDLRAAEDEATAPAADYKTANENFAKARQAAEDKALAQVPDETHRAALRLQLTRTGLQSEARVKATSVGREQEANIASLNTLELDVLNRAARAGSPVERQAVIGEYAARIDGQAGAGWLSATQAAARKVNFSRALEQSDFARLSRDNPALLASELADPAKFAHLDPVTREGYVTDARNAVEGKREEAASQMARLDPVRGLAMAGRVARLSDAGAIMPAIIQVESSGRPDVVSEKGALGVAQLMPDTARAMARKIGRPDIAGMDDAALRQTLLGDPTTNRQLGQAYLEEGLARYEGNIWAAAARYNAGPGNADKPRADAWHAEAVQKFGPNYSAAQLSSLIPIKETRDYVLKVARQMGADPSAPTLGARGALVVSSAAAEEMGRPARMAGDLARAAREADPILELQKAGVPLGDARLSSWLMAQDQAAAMGDSAAAKAARDVRERAAMAPMIEAAYARPPAELDGIKAQMEARLRDPAAKATAADLHFSEAIGAVAAEVKSKAADQHVELGERSRIVRPVAIDPQGDVRAPAFREALTARFADTARAAEFYGVPQAPKPFKPAEVLEWKARWEGASDRDKADMLASFARAAPSAAVFRGAVTQVAGADPAASAAARVAMDRPALAAEILRGDAISRLEGVKDKAAVVAQALKSKIGGEAFPPAMLQDVITGALAHYAAQRGSNGALWDTTDASALERSIEAMTGARLKHNGYRTYAPAGMNAATFEGHLGGIDNADLARFGGAFDGAGAAIKDKTIRADGWFRPLEPGGSRYLVMLPSADGKGAPVLTQDQRPLVIDIGEIARRAPEKYQASIAARMARDPAGVEIDQRTRMMRNQYLRRAGHDIHDPGAP